MKIVLLMVTLLLTLYGNSWKSVKKQAGIEVLTKRVEGSDYLAFKATLLIDASIAELLAVMYDTEACPEWLYECSEGFTLEQESFEENYVYERYDLLFPLKDRSVILHSTLIWQEKEAQLMMQEAQSFCDRRTDLRCQRIKSKDTVAVVRSRGVYRFEWVSSHKTRVTWRQHTEPGGSLPTWLVNAMIIELPFNSLKALREIVKKERYRGMSREKLRRAWQRAYDRHHLSRTKGVL